MPMVFRLLCIGLAFSVLANRPAHAAASTPERFNVIVTGNGPDVILIPGLASSAHVWDATVARLATGHRLHILQVKGFAGTPAGANADGPVIAPLVADIAAYIEANRLSRPAVIGHSMGGLVGLLLAADHPGDVGRLMIVDALPFFGMIQGPQATVASIEPGVRAMRDRTATASPESFAAVEARVMAGLVKSTGPAAQAAIAAAQASDPHVVATALYEDAITDLRPRLAGIETPTTMLYPWDADSGLPQERFDALYRGAYAAMPHATVMRIDDSRHFIMIDQPEIFQTAVESFLAAQPRP